MYLVDLSCSCEVEAFSLPIGFDRTKWCCSWRVSGYMNALRELAIVLGHLLCATTSKYVLALEAKLLGL